MKTITATEARSKIYQLLEEVASSHEPLQITSKRGKGILIASEDWQSITETLNLLQIPGMRESIQKGLATPIEQCDKELSW